MTYSSSVAASKTHYLRKNQNTVSFNRSAKSLGPISNSVILIFLACLIGLLYLTQVTKTNSYGYTINNLKQQQAELKNQKSELEIASARLQALDRVTSSQVAKGLVPATASGTIEQ